MYIFLQNLPILLGKLVIHICSTICNQPIELLSIRIELMNKSLLHCELPNNNTTV